MDDDDIMRSIDAVGPRLRAVREERGATLSNIADASGISVSTLSRLESGRRKPTLELLLRLARAHGTPVERLVGDRTEADPRVTARPIRRDGCVFVPLTRRPGGVQAFKVIIDPVERHTPGRDLASHEGYEWLYILNGRARLILGELDLTMGAGEAAEFDTHTPHWFGCADERPAELIVLFGPQGERMHIRTSTRS